MLLHGRAHFALLTGGAGGGAWPLRAQTVEAPGARWCGPGTRARAWWCWNWLEASHRARAEGPVARMWVEASHRGRADGPGGGGARGAVADGPGGGRAEGSGEQWR